METIKVELDKMCKGCLSADRRGQALGDCSELYFNLLGDHQFTINDTKDMWLCWECIALLKRIKTFQTRIRNAQIVLMKTLYELNPDPICLSTLSTALVDHFDITILNEQSEDNHITEIINNVSAEIKQELVVNENNLSDIITKYEEFEYEGCTEFEGDIVEDNFVKTELKHNNNSNLNKIKRQSIRNYEKYAKVNKVAAIDRSNIKKYFVKVFLNEKEIEDVLSQRQKDKGMNKLPHKCHFCNVKYGRAVDLRRHKDLRHNHSTGPYSCSECKAIMRSQKSLEKHWRSHTQVLKCVICSHLCKSLGEISKHLNRAHSRSFTCVLCGAQSGTLREFSNHYKKAHERVTCDHCQKSFIKKSSLEKHIIRNHLPARCAVCRRTYAHYHVLENHCRMYHPEMVSAAAGPELAYCVECDKQYGSVYRYKRHIAQSARHTPQKRVRVPCPECGKVFTRTTYMNNHYRLVHVKDTKHCCDLCNKIFSTGYAVRKHRQFVHEKLLLPKNKICDICGRGFSTNRILTNHRRTHTGERPFKCEHCPATFAQQTAMKTHQKTQHKNVIHMQT